MCDTATGAFDDADADVAADDSAAPEDDAAGAESAAGATSAPGGSGTHGQQHGASGRTQIPHGLRSRSRKAAARRLREEVLTAEGIDPTWRGYAADALGDHDGDEAFEEGKTAERDAGATEQGAGSSSGAEQATGAERGDAAEGAASTPTRTPAQRTGDSTGRT